MDRRDVQQPGPLRENVTRWRCRSGVRFHFELFNVQAFNSPSPRNALIQRMRPLLFQCAHLGIGFILNEFAESVEEVRYGGIHLLEAHFFSARASQSITAFIRRLFSNERGVRYDFLG